MPIRFLRAALAALVTAASSQAFAVVDQFNAPHDPARISTQFNGLEWQQEVVVGIGGLLTGIDLFTAEAPGSFTISLNPGTGWQSDADAFRLAVSPTAFSTLSIDVSAAGLVFDAGDTFVIGIEAGPAGPCCGLLASGGNGANLYQPGRLRNSFGTPLNGLDLAFRTHVQAVPEPQTYALMLAGLAAVGIARRRRR